MEVCGLLCIKAFHLAKDLLPTSFWQSSAEPRHEQVCQLIERAFFDVPTTAIRHVEHHGVGCGPEAYEHKLLHSLRMSSCSGSEE